MKKLFILPLLSLVLFACDNTTDEDFEAFAKDACGCVNESTAQLSPEMLKILDEFGGDKVKMQEMMAEYAAENPTQAMEDASLMQGAVINDFTQCLDKVQKKYSDKYTSKTDEEVQEALLAALKEMDGCESSYGMVKMALGK